LIITATAAPRAAAATILIAPGHQNLFARIRSQAATLPCGRGQAIARYRYELACFQRNFNNFPFNGNEMFQFVAVRRT
jgi:hypothetical protein